MKISIGGESFWVNFHHLYCFHMIATEGNLTRAAQILGIGGSALSIQMRQFESHLGFPLFDRAHRKLSLNERGKIVHAYASEIFRLGGEMIEAVHDRPTESRTHLHLGALDTIPKHLTVQLVAQAIKDRHCSVSVVEGKQSDLLRGLTEHRIDLMVTNFLPLVEPGQIYSRCIARLPLWVVGGKSFTKLKKDFPASLTDQPLIVPTGDSRVRHEFDHFCVRHGLKPDVIAEIQDLSTQKLLAVQQVGLTVIPEFAIREYLASKQLYLIGNLKGIYEELFLVSGSRKIENPVASFLMKRFQVT